MREVLDFLQRRRSVPARLLGEPAPGESELAEVFAAAVAVPDHGALRPWRFFVLRGAARERLGDLFVVAAKAREPELAPAALQAVREKALRAPLVIAVAAAVTLGHPKVPPVEQLLSAAAAVQNILLALQALGYGAVLLTGSNCYAPEVKAGFGLAEKDALIGFIHVGTPAEPPAPKVRPDPRGFWRSWEGPVSPGS